jgi:hypothetical protein
MLMNRKTLESRNKIMNIIDLRKKLQQSSTSEQRVSDRRKISYSFGSPEWLEYMKDNNLECPEEHDRRQVIRRDEDREPSSEEPEITDSKTTYRRIFLTPNERKLLQDIYLSDLD